MFRPGGSALNAGQVGSTRATTYIAQKRKGTPKATDTFLATHHPQITQKLQMATAHNPNGKSPACLLSELQCKMSEFTGIVRNSKDLQNLLDDIHNKLIKLETSIYLQNSQDIAMMYQYYDLLICAKGYVTAMLEFSEKGLSRSSALYPCETGKHSLCIPFPCHYQLENGEYTNKIQEILYNPATQSFTCSYRTVRPIPVDDTPFETVWRTYRETKNIE